MISLPENVDNKYGVYLDDCNVLKSDRWKYKKWLAFYLHFCSKYKHDSSNLSSLPLFLDKLSDKKQTEMQRKEALKAVDNYFSMLKNKDKLTIKENWDRVIDTLIKEIQLRHYSKKTLQTYVGWNKRLKNYFYNKNPQGLEPADIKKYLEYLTCNKKVSASTQNQAFNALLFLYRHVLHKELGDISDTIRPKRRRYIPVVLSQREVQELIGKMYYPYSLIAKMQYGCGLRISEVINLRVQDFNFD